MALWLDVVRAAAALNAVLLLVLTAVWVRNYRTFGSKHALGFVVFGVVLLAENVTALYVFGLDPALSAWYRDHMTGSPADATMSLRVLETGAICLLAWLTWD
mgnify:CR=1 FL=1